MFERRECRILAWCGDAHSVDIQLMFEHLQPEKSRLVSGHLDLITLSLNFRGWISRIIAVMNLANSLQHILTYVSIVFDPQIFALTRP